MPASKKPSPFESLKNVARPNSPVNSRTAQLSEGMSSRRLPGAMMLPLTMISPNPRQIRTHYDEAPLKELADDIKARGVLEPLLVRETSPGQYEIIAGERRFKAAGMAGLSEVPVIVREMDNSEANFAMLIENIQRENLDPRDEQRYFQSLQNEYNYSIKQIAELIHKSRHYVSSRLNGEFQEGEQGLNAITGEGTNSDENHNMSRQDILLKPSQIVKEREGAVGRTKSGNEKNTDYNLQAFKRFNQTLDRTILYFSQTKEQNPETRNKLKASVEELSRKLEELKKQLES
ncbi:MAG TPA: ParB/RepB/Spo0J family partition protein [Chloroflexia bacterium]|nr:ParB/RepB/Spo0J family partition protein [Chloroflexia bacterium]